MNPKISLIICTYNRRDLVPRAIESALAQEGVDLEVIVVDDCSDDGTVGYLQERYGSQIKVARTNVNSGVSTATNVGYQQSTGEYIALLGDDDYWEDPRKLAKQLKVMKENPRIGVSGTWWVELREGGERVEKTPLSPRSRYFLKERMLAGGGIVAGSTALITKRAWDAVGGMDEKHVRGTDSDIFRRILIKGFDVRVLPYITTIGDVSHGHRMTNSDEIYSLTKHRHSQLRSLAKHAFFWPLYPRAFLVRIMRILKLSSLIFFIKTGWRRPRTKR